MRVNLIVYNMSLCQVKLLQHWSYDSSYPHKFIHNPVFLTTESEHYIAVFERSVSCSHAKLIKYVNWCRYIFYVLYLWCTYPFNMQSNRYVYTPTPGWDSEKLNLPCQERMMTSSLFRRNNDDVIMRSWPCPCSCLLATKLILYQYKKGNL